MEKRVHAAESRADEGEADLTRELGETRDRLRDVEVRAASFLRVNGVEGGRLDSILPLVNHIAKRIGLLHDL